MPIIDKIQLSGTVYTIGNETTTAVTSASTDNEIPTAKAVYDAIPQGGGGTIDQSVISGSTNAVSGGAVYTQLGGLKLQKITQSAYDALSPNYDANTLYVING